MTSDVQGDKYKEKLRCRPDDPDRRRGNLIETFKTLKGFNKVDKKKWFEEIGAEARAT